MTNKYRSKFERRIGDKISHIADYEPIKVKYVVPATNHTYTPDWVWKGYWIEQKGRLTAADRRKMLYIREQYPTQNIVFVFQNPNVKLSKVSKTTYEDWALKHGFMVWSQEQLVRRITSCGK